MIYQQTKIGYWRSSTRGCIDGAKFIGPDQKTVGRLADRTK